MYTFTNLLPYLKLTEKSLRSWYDRDASNDELVIFTTKKHAQQEALANHQTLLRRASEAGIDYVINGYQGIQIIKADHNSDLTSEMNHVLGQEFVDGYNSARNSQSSYFSDMDWYIKYHNSQCGPGASAWHQHWRGVTTLPQYRGVFRVGDGAKISDRQQQLQLFWDLGFLGRRRRVLYAALQSSGTPADVLAYRRLRSEFEALPRNSQLRAGFFTGIQRTERDCDWPRP